MPEKNGIEQIVERAVSQALEVHLPRLQAEIVQRVVQEIGPQLGQAPSVSAGGNTAELVKALSFIQSGSSQKDILRALLDSTAGYCGRAALFVVKGGAATGWQGRGFANGDALKDFALDLTTGVAARAMQSRMALSGGPIDIDPNFAALFGMPGDGQVMALPLLLKDKVAALVYADAGTESGPPIDPASLELLVTATSAWLEVASVRKQAQKESAETTAARPEAPPVQTVSAYPDPFAGHTPSHTAAPPPPVPASAVAEAAVAEGAPVAVAEQMSPEDADTHRKAQRFARLLVDEVKLYNQVKVTEGRKHKDMYDRLKEDIEKSRTMYQKRYGNTVAASGDYFNQELVRSLAEDDSSAMGANFRR